MKIAVLVSGGVDSSLALRLLKEQGHELTAFYLKIWLEDELAYLGNCPWQEDLSFVQAVCKQLEVPLEVISLQKEYWQEVVWHVVAQVKAGNTPNPDILCNQRIKFGAFFNCIDGSYEKVATGHYAQVVMQGAQAVLMMSPDVLKDQTYFLSHLNQDQLRRALFPIGHLTKSDVRQLAAHYNLATQARKDSQGICFLGTLDFAAFLRHHLGEKSGDLIEIETGKKVGTHSGFWFYTIGQRQGIKLAGGPWYVVDKLPEENKIFISKSYYDPEKIRNTVTVGQLHWIAGCPPLKNSLYVKLRHGSQRYKADIFWHNDHSITLKLDGHDQGIAPGQSAVFYDDMICLGAGIIVKPRDFL